MGRADRLLNEAKLTGSEEFIMQQIATKLKERGTKAGYLHISASEKRNLAAAYKLVDKDYLTVGGSSRTTAQAKGAWGKPRRGFEDVNVDILFNITPKGMEYVKHDPSAMPKNLERVIKEYEPYYNMTVDQYRETVGRVLPMWVDKEGGWHNKTMKEFVAHHIDLVMTGRW